MIQRVWFSYQVQGSGFRVYLNSVDFTVQHCSHVGLIWDFRVQGLGFSRFRIQGSALRVWVSGSGLRVQSSGLRVQG